MTTIAVIDTETDRFDGEEGAARVIELAAVEVTDDRVSGDTVRSWQFSPGEGGVTPRASAVHHLTAVDLRGCRPFDAEAWRLAIGSADYIAAHNAAFDRAQVERAAPDTGAPWLCTMKMARVAWPECPSHSNQVLRYWLGLDPALPPTLYPHRAGYDAIVTAHLLVRLLEHFGGDLARMLVISQAPSLLPRVPFGANRGRPWAEMEPGFLRWVLDPARTFDEDVRYTALHWLERLT